MCFPTLKRLFISSQSLGGHRCKVPGLENKLFDALLVRQEWKAQENVSRATICLKQTTCSKLFQLHVVCLDGHECSDTGSPPFNPCKSIFCAHWRKGQWFWFTAFASLCGPVWHEAWQKRQKYRNWYWGMLRDDRKKSILAAGRQNGSNGFNLRTRFSDRLGLLRRLRLTLLKPLTRRGQDSTACYMVNKALGRVCHNSAAGAL